MCEMRHDVTHISMKMVIVLDIVVNVFPHLHVSSLFFATQKPNFPAHLRPRKIRILASSGRKRIRTPLLSILTATSQVNGLLLSRTLPNACLMYTQC